MGSNTHGKVNESSIAYYLNGKKYKDIPNLNLKTFIDELCPTISDETIIYCNSSPSIKKQDIEIRINSNKYLISVQTGSGNSIHQEKLESFIIFLQNTYKISDNLCNDIRFFIWGDETTDGTGKRTDRLSAIQIKKKYPNIIANINDFFALNRKDLLTRFLILGAHNSHIDYIYYGTPVNGLWCKASEALEFHENFIDSSKSSIKIGKITFQSWNRCITGTKKEKDRDTVQLKWGTIENDIQAIRDSRSTALLAKFEGDKSEFNFCRELNRNKNSKNKHWNILRQHIPSLDNLENVYAVKVSKNAFSQLSQGLVWPKADVFLISANIDPQFLLLHNFLLDESNIAKLNYAFIAGSGISVKRKDSSKYTIQKLTVNSFEKLFGSTILGAGASLYCNEKEVHKNDSVLLAWRQSYQTLAMEFSNLKSINLLSSSNPIDIIKACKEIKECSNRKIAEIISSDPHVSNVVFKGEGNFSEPYVASFIFKGGELLENLPIDITITTGSGRSKGMFSIEIKPK